MERNIRQRLFCFVWQCDDLLVLAGPFRLASYDIANALDIDISEGAAENTKAATA